MKKVLNVLKTIALGPFSILMAADFAAAGGKNIRASQMSSTPAAALYYFATLHSGAIVLTSASTTYAASGINELATGNGYTAGGKSLGTMTATGAAIDCADVAWATTSGQTLSATHLAVWVNTTNSIAGAQLIGVKDPSQAISGTTTNGSTSVTGVTNASTLVNVGSNVTGTGIPAGTTVTAVSGTTVTLSQNATASGTVTLTFANQATASNGGSLTQPITNLLTMT